jgi:hypothetical protein
MLSWEHGGGFSLHASVRIEEDDREGLERLLRYCARPPFALERIEELESGTIIYHVPDSGEDGRTELRLTPFELIARIAALVPPPRLHRLRYFGVLAPNSPLRSQVTALAQAGNSSTNTSQPESPPSETDSQQQPQLPSAVSTSQQESNIPNSGSSRISWAILLARIYEVFPLLCPMCGGTIRIISFVTETPTIHRILEHIGEPTEPPKIAPARGPPDWDEGSHQDSYGDPLAQSAPDYEFDQTLSW